MKAGEARNFKASPAFASPVGGNNPVVTDFFRKEECAVQFSDLAAEALLSAPGLRHREGQVEMLRLIGQSLAGERPEKIVAVEAGTGVGKSLAYLVPIMLRCLEAGRRAVVATGTKNLQDQLAKKDAPLAADLVARAAGKRPTVAVLYGKSNYLCPALLQRRMQELEERIFLSPPAQDELAFLESLAAWLRDGGSGFKEDLPAWPDAPGAQCDRERWWARVSAADDDADCRACGDDEKGACAFRAAREAAARADVVVANHHLLAADFLLRERVGLSVLAEKNERPPEVLIIDEAHDFPEAVRSSLEAAFTRARAGRLRADVLRFLKDLADWADKHGFDGGAERALEAAEAWADERFPALDAYLGGLFAWAEKALAGKDRRPCFPGQVPEGAEDVLRQLESFFSPGAGLIGFARPVVEALEPAAAADRDLERDFSRLRRRFARLKERFEELCEAFRRAVLLERHYRLLGPEGDVCWIEPGRFAAHPLDVSGWLRQFWAAHENVVLTSATMFPFPQSDGFAWFQERYGLDPGRAVMGVVPSPFNYHEQMRALILTDPDLLPREKNGENGNGGGEEEQASRRARRLAEEVVKVAAKARGGVMVLFTAVGEMRQVAELAEPLLPEGRILLVQRRDGGKAEILARYREHGRAVLFGVDSFWQGVDLPGELLTSLVIAKLPFPCPDDPQVEAEVYLAGRDWWKKVYRPRAALTLRQGVGRLIRTEEDRGVVVICDPRAAGRHRQLVRSCLPVEPREVNAI